MARGTGRGEEKGKMMENTQQAKTALRTKIAAELKQLNATERAAAAIKACALLEQQAVWRSAKAILFYAPLADEPDLWRLLEDSLATGKTVALPRFHPEQGDYVACLIKQVASDLQTGKFGIREPRESCPIIPLNRLDFVLVPGVAFDLNGHRLGRGKGYYDRLLAMSAGSTCGVAFDQQIVSQVPSEPHDVRLSCILTPTRWHEVTGPRAVLK
jgi:5-formyltetrahydrofolate cyclo-ligase